MVIPASSSSRPVTISTNRSIWQGICGLKPLVSAEERRQVTWSVNVSTLTSHVCSFLIEWTLAKKEKGPKTACCSLNGQQERPYLYSLENVVL
jgi:hypothetical protein